MGGDTAVALELLERAERMAEDLVARAPGSVMSRLALANSLSSLGSCSQDLGDLAAARSRQQRAVDICEELGQSDPKDPMVCEARARAWMALGTAQQCTDGPRVALPSWQQAIRILQGLVAADPGSARLRRVLGDAWRGAGLFLGLLGDTTAALTACQSAVDLIAGIAATDPSNSRAKLSLMSAELALAQVQEQAGQPPEALENLRHACALGEALERAQLAPSARYLLAVSEMGCGQVLLACGLPPLALPQIQGAAERLEVLSRQSARLLTIRRSLANAHSLLGMALLGPDAAVPRHEHMQRAIALQDEVCRADPEDLEARLQLAQILTELARVQAMSAEFDAALAGLERSLGILAELPGPRARDVEVQHALALTWSRIGVIRSLQGNTREAEAGLGQALAVMEPLFGAVPNHKNSELLRGILDKLAQFAAAAGRTDAALGLEQRSWAAFAARADRSDATIVELNNCAWGLLTCEQPGLRDPGKALRLAERAVDLTRGKNIEVLDTLALACFQSGNAARAVEALGRLIALLPVGSSLPADVAARQQYEAQLRQYQAALQQPVSR